MAALPHRSPFVPGMPGRQIEQPWDVTGATFGYLEYLPEDYGRRTDVLHPLLIFLHGAAERGDGVTELSRVKAAGLPKDIAQGRHFPAIVISPQTTDWWQYKTSKLDRLVEFLKKHYPADPERIYLTGISMGGGGVWAYARDYPKKAAAIVPICGALEAHRAERLRDVPVWAFHSDGDPLVNVDYTYGWINGIRTAGGNPRLTIYHSSDHDAWTPAYTDPKLWDWFFSQSRGARQPAQRSAI